MRLSLLLNEHKFSFSTRIVLLFTHLRRTKLSAHFVFFLYFWEMPKEHWMQHAFWHWTTSSHEIIWSVGLREKSTILCTHAYACQLGYYSCTFRAQERVVSRWVFDQIQIQIQKNCRLNPTTILPTHYLTKGVSGGDNILCRSSLIYCVRITLNVCWKALLATALLFFALAFTFT